MDALLMKRIAPSREMSGMTFIFAVLILIFGIFVLSSAPGGAGFFGIIFILAGVFIVNPTHLKKYTAPGAEKC